MAITLECATQPPLSPLSEIARIAVILDDPAAPSIIKMDWPGVRVGGNTDSLLPVYADKFGRLWREEKDRLTRIYPVLNIMDKAPGMFSVRNDIREEEIFSDRVNGRLRRTPEERAAFADNCPSNVRAAAQALYDRFIELGLRPPYSVDDGTWPDLADTAIRAAAKMTVEMQRQASSDLQQAMKDRHG